MVALAAAGLVYAAHRYQMARHARGQLAQADLASEEGDTGAQLASLSRYIEFAPKDVAARSRYGLLLAREAQTRRDRWRALQVLNTAISHDPGRAETRVKAAELALDLGDPGEAMRHLAPAISQEPDDPDWHDLHARILLALGKEGDTAAALVRTLELDPGRTQAARRLATLYHDKLRRPRQADAVLDRMVSRSTDRPAALLARARFRAARGREDEAAADLQEAVRLAPGDLMGRVQWAELADRRGDLATAIEQWGAAVALAPTRPELALGLGRALSEAGRKDDAGDALADGLNRIPAHPAIVLALGVVRCEQGRLADAEALRSRLPAEAKAASLYLTGLIRRRGGDPTGAAVALVEAVKLGTLPAEIRARALLALCDIYRDAGAREERFHAARLAYQIADDVVTRVEYGAAALEVGLIDEALAALRAASGSPRRPAGLPLLLTRALVEQNAGLPGWRRSWVECERELAAAARHPPSAAEAALLRGRVLELRGRPGEARTALEAAVRASPGRPDGWLALAAFEQRQGNGAGVGAAIRGGDTHLKGNVEWVMARAAGAPAGVERDRALGWADRLPGADRDRVQYQLAALFAGRGQFADADPLCNRLLERRPDDHPVRYLLTQARLAAGDEAEAARHIAGLRRREGEGGVWWRCAEAERLMRRDPAAARELAEEGARLQPLLARPALLLARIADLSGDPKTALKHYLDALDRGEWSPQPLQRALQLLIAAGRHADADRLLERAQTRGALEASLARPAAAIALQAGRPRRARELALAAVPASPRDYRDLVWLARVLEEAGQVTEAERYLKQASDLAPDAFDPWLTLIRLRRADRRPGAARQALDDMVRAMPPDRRRLAEALGAEALGRPLDAVAALRGRLAERPRDPEAMRRLAELYVRLNRPEEAEPCLKALLADDGPAQPEQVPGLRRSLALMITGAEGGAGRVEEAVRVLARNRDGGGGSGDDRRVEALVRGARPDGAADGLKQLEALPAPTAAPERLRMAQLFDAAGEWPRAYSMLRRLVTDDPDNPAYLEAMIDGLARNNKRAEATLWLARLKGMDPDGGRLRRLERLVNE